MMDKKMLEQVFEHHCEPELFHDLKANVRWLERQRLVSTFETDELFT